MLSGYVTTPATTTLANRTWTRVTGLTNGFAGAELLSALAVNPDGAVTRETHNSANSGWAFLRFTPVEATGVRIFHHHKVREFEACGPR